MDIEVKLYDEKAWKVSTTRFTLQVYGKNTTNCKYMLQVKLKVSQYVEKEFSTFPLLKLFFFSDGVWMITCSCVLVLLVIGGLCWKESEVIEQHMIIVVHVVLARTLWIMTAFNPFGLF